MYEYVYSQCCGFIRSHIQQYVELSKNFGFRVLGPDLIIPLCRKQTFKIGGIISNMIKKRNSSQGEKYETKVVGNCSSYCSKFFNFIKSEKRSSYCHKTLISANFSSNNKKCLFQPYLLRFSDFIKMKKKIGTVT